jgi:hypothetical protein
LQSYSRPSGFEPEVRLVNLYIEEDQSGASPDKFLRLQRPGLAPYVTLSAVIRGMFRKDGVGDGLPLVAAGGSLYETDGVTNTLIGSIDNDAATVAMAANAFGVGIASAGTFYFYDGAALTTIAMPDDVQIIGIEDINSYLILPLSNGTFYWLVPGASTVDPLDFADAESSPDGLVGVKRLNDELFFFGVSSIEIWQTTGNLDLPFQRASGRLFDRGCLGADTIQNLDNTLFFVGDDAKVYRIASVPERISTPAIEERLRNRTDDPSAWSFAWEGHLFYILRIPGVGTYAYDAQTQVWSEFASFGATVWAPHMGVSLSEETVLCGDATTGKIWKLDGDRGNDDGLTMERIVTGSIPGNGKPFRNNSLTVLVGSSADCTIRARWWDGRQTPPTTYQTMAARAPVDNPSLFRLGAAHQPVRTFEVSCIDDVRIRISGALLNEAWRG